MQDEYPKGSHSNSIIFYVWWRSPYLLYRRPGERGAGKERLAERRRLQKPNPVGYGGGEMIESLLMEKVDRLKAINAELLEACKALSLEIKGIDGEEFRSVFGNTNFNCLIRKVEKAEQAIKKAEEKL